MSGFTFCDVEKQGGTALYAVSRSSPRPTQASFVPGVFWCNLDAWGIFLSKETTHL